MRKRRSRAMFLSVVLAASLVQAIAPPAAWAAGPSVPSTPVPSESVTQQGRQAVNTGDETTPRGLSGDQTGGSSLPGAGNYAATSLSPSATWQVSGQTGDFTWTYPLPVPSAPGGLNPNLGLSYSSGAVDGLTSATNNQASWIGDGWSLWPGFVERGYRSCAEDVDGTGEKPADLCWHSDNATLSLNGSGTQLIRDDDSEPGDEVWKAKDDDGSRIERITAAGNGDDNNEAWKITTVDGTQYFFGTSVAAKSTWTVPVFGDDAGEPCHGSTFAASWCTQGYRWNLDKVVDRHGNMIQYFYATETNSYGRNKNTAVSSYVRGGWLDRIEYGMHAANSTASGRVEFTVADRCVKRSDCTHAKPANLPDVPLNLKCDGATCTDKWAPSFWTTKKLTTVTTKSLVDGQYKPVDSWALSHELPDPGDGEKPALWLKSIQHTGHTGPAATPTITLPEVTFDGVRMENRVHGVDGYASLVRFRMNAIVSETGGITSIRYAEPDCVFGTGMPEHAHNNEQRCFPAKWTPPFAPERTDYFHKYVVSAVSTHDGVAGTLADETSYEYLDGAAWHWDTSEFVKEDKKTWNEFRGYSRVRVRHGTTDDGPRTMSEQRFYRGMHGDKQPSGTRPATVTDSEGAERDDFEWLQGFSFETAMFEREAASNATDPRRISKTITHPVWHGPTATRGSLNAYIVRANTERTYTAVGASGERVTQTDTTYDTQWGLPTSTSDLGDTSTDADDLCTTTTYQPNETRWLIDFPSRVETVSVRCGQTPVFPQDAISDTLTYYDGQQSGLPPSTAGNATEVRVASSRPATGPVYVTTAKSTYDARGRVLTATDALGNTTTTAYTPQVAGPVTQVATTTPGPQDGAAGFTTTTTYEKWRGQPTKIVDENDSVTEVAYDALGRSTEVWLPNRLRARHANGNYKFSYLIRKSGPIVVTTRKLSPNDINYVTTNEIYDGQLRPRQLQTPAPGGGRLLTDTRYDSQGRVVKTSRPYYNTGAVDTELWFPTDNVVPNMTEYVYDAAGRPTVQKFLSNGTEKWRSTTTYGGDRVTVTPPEGGTPVTTITDARGRKTELHEHGPDGADIIRYEYTPAGQLSKVTDPGGNVWTYTYDLRGRKIAETDPDRGGSSYTYDDAGQLVSSTDARDTTLVYEYDNLGRKTVLHRDSVTGPRLADWTYDTVPYSKGLPAATTRYVGASAYTTRVLSYTAEYQPVQTEIEIPASEGPELAGKYTSTLQYKADGSLASETYPAAGALPQEGVAHSYSDLGLPLRTWGGFGGNTYEYVLNTDYTRYGEPQTITLGQDTKRAWLSYYYQADTRRLDRTVVDAEVPDPMQADYRYTYDDIGNITSVADIPAGLPSDVQCFRYDHLRRLTEAWTPTNGCATNPAASALGGPAPYWQSYGYDKTGNRVEQTDHDAADDTTSTYTYQGHRLDSATTTTGGVTTLDEYDYDPTGNTTSRVLAGEDQTLEWDAEGHLAKVTEDGKETTYVYTADGTRLIRRDPQAVTLYLGNQEIRLDRNTQTTTGTRYYSHGGQRIATRTEASLNWVATDHNGTGEVSINSNTQQVSRRRHLPFGEPRGQAPPSWPSELGFVGGTMDASTGLTHLGAREYDPTLGRFISVDPIMDLTNAQQMNGYTYSNNNPVTFSDPTGLFSWEGDSSPTFDTGTCKHKKCDKPKVPPAVNEPSDAYTQMHYNSPVFGKTLSNAALDALKARGYKGSALFTRREALLFATQSKEAAAAVCHAFADGGGTSPSACKYDVWNWEGVLTGLKAVLEFAYQLTPIPDAIGCAGGDGEACAWLAVGAIPGGRVLRAADNMADAANAAHKAQRACGPNSFIPGTKVLMADGTTKPIEDIKVGDKVLATDPVRGETAAKTVVGTITTQGRKNLVKLTVDTDGTTGDKTGTIVATAAHPFWGSEQRRWLAASALHAGEGLADTRGATVDVVAVDVYSQTRRVHNLTVADIHTYYVLTGQTPVLVHNANCNVGTRQFNHAWDQHSPEGAYAKAGKMENVFAAGINKGRFREMLDEAIENGTKVPRSKSDPRGGHYIDYDFGDMEFGAMGQNGIRIVVDGMGNFVTAMPKFMY
ncbi:polymorphic toxin-type HINT domain-containing protein [Actinophytocola glycyrrhizae]|uniref:Polymorphic toxin-type HINT domain-containing protein n=1 Tax=Actinophytocola glycyrrhizae TaxID=2044873 RepID=A0ABV9RX34_9PSEU